MMCNHKKVKLKKLKLFRIILRKSYKDVYHRNNTPVINFMEYNTFNSYKKDRPTPLTLIRNAINTQNTNTDEN